MRFRVQGSGFKVQGSRFKFFCEIDFCLGEGDRVLVECGEVHLGSDRYAVDFFVGKGGSDSFFSIHTGAPFCIRNHEIRHIVA